MALKPCPECKREISTEAEACPHCGAKRKKSSLGSGCLLILVVFATLTAIGWLLDSPSVADAPPKQSKVADVSIAYNEVAVEITNDGSPNWTTAEIYLNGSPPFSYKATVVAPAVGKSVRIPLASFVKKDGTRFNPLTHAVTEIWVGGNGFDFKQYRVSR
jgi:hypothetical protein